MDGHYLVLDKGKGVAKPPMDRVPDGIFFYHIWYFTADSTAYKDNFAYIYYRHGLGISRSLGVFSAKKDETIYQACRLSLSAMAFRHSVEN